jgi:uncharacterized membrane protein
MPSGPLASGGDVMAYSNILVGAGPHPAQPVIKKISVADLRDVLAKGIDDFYAMPTHAIFLCIIYPIVGFVLARLTFGYSILPLLFPLASGFALVGPAAALGLYELSRRKEAGLDTSVSRAFDIFESSSIGAIAALGLLLLVIFAIWVAVANAIYISNFGYASPSSIEEFLYEVLTTRAGWTLIIVGNGIGLLFAMLVLTISVVSFPLLLDRDVGAAVALLTSIQAVIGNPLTMAVWGLIVGALLVIGSIPFFFGLTVVMPVLGHATWHLYRKVIEPQGSSPQIHLPQDKGRRYAADFPVVLFPWARK